MQVIFIFCFMLKMLIYCFWGCPRWFFEWYLFYALHVSAVMIFFFVGLICVGLVNCAFSLGLEVS